MLTPEDVAASIEKFQNAIKTFFNQAGPVVAEALVMVDIKEIRKKMAELKIHYDAYIQNTHRSFQQQFNDYFVKNRLTQVQLQEIQQAISNHAIEYSKLVTSLENRIAHLSTPSYSCLSIFCQGASSDVLDNTSSRSPEKKSFCNIL